MRENTKSEGVRFIFAIRCALLALGAALADENVLDNADDIFFLMWDEIGDVRSGALEARELVAERRAEHERNRLLHPPPIVVGEWDAADESAFEYEDAEAELSGIPVASGTVRGRARVIRSVDSAETVSRGEILVAPFTDPGWTPYFVPAAGIVMDMGGLLSHGSIIAREYGMPAVVNVGPATSLIATGDLIEVDGDAGAVRIIERKDDEARAEGD
jgi:pyruvate,water dikinase